MSNIFTLGPFKQGLHIVIIQAYFLVFINDHDECCQLVMSLDDVYRFYTYIIQDCIGPINHI